mgnify:FL=1
MFRKTSESQRLFLYKVQTGLAVGFMRQLHILTHHRHPKASVRGLLSLVDLDLTGLKCPLPVLKARKALRDYDEGAEVRIRVTDPRAPADFKALCDTVGHSMISEERDGDGKILTLRVHKPQA